MCEIRSLGNLKHLDAVFILNALIKYQRLSELDTDNTLQKAIYGAGLLTESTYCVFYLRLGCL